MCSLSPKLANHIQGNLIYKNGITIQSAVIEWSRFVFFECWQLNGKSKYNWSGICSKRDTIVRTLFGQKSKQLLKAEHVGRQLFNIFLNVRELTGILIQKQFFMFVTSLGWFHKVKSRKGLVLSKDIKTFTNSSVPLVAFVLRNRAIEYYL